MAKNFLAGIASDMIGKICETSKVDTNSLMFANIVDDNNTYHDVWTVAKNIYNNVIKSFGFSFLIIYFLIAIIDTANNNDMITPEQIFKLLAKLAAGIYLVGHGIDLCEYFIKFGVALSNVLQSKISSSDTGVDIAEKMQTTVSNMGRINALGAIMVLFIPWLISMVGGITVTIIGISRIIMLAYKIMFMPVAVCNAFNRGFEDSGAGKYIKEILALCLQGTVIIVIGYICNVVMGADFVKVGDSPSVMEIATVGFQMGAVSIAKIGLMFKSLDMIKSVMGV